MALTCGDQTDQGRHGEVIAGAEAEIDRGKSERRGIETAARVGDAGIIQPVDVGLALKKVLRIRFAQVIHLPVVYAELEGMVADNFSEVIDKIFHRHMRVNGGGKGVDIVHSAEMHEGLGLQSLEVDELADVTKVKIVDQGAAQGSRVTNREALVVVVLDLLLRAGRETARRRLR